MPETTQSTTTQFTIGAEVSCSDGVCGNVTRVIVESRRLLCRGPIDV